jgi:DNA-binding MarR family transcriptional regulator
MILTVQLTPLASVESVTDEVMDFLSRLKKSGEAHILGVARGLDLSFSQMRALFVLFDSQQELAVHELAGQLGLSMATAGRAVQGLVRAEMVTRREDGRRFVDSLMQAHRDAVRECLESLSAREREQLSQALAPILARGDLPTTTTGC